MTESLKMRPSDQIKIIVVDLNRATSAPQHLSYVRTVLLSLMEGGQWTRPLLNINRLILAYALPPKKLRGRPPCTYVVNSHSFTARAKYGFVWPSMPKVEGGVRRGRDGLYGKEDTVFVEHFRFQDINIYFEIITHLSPGMKFRAVVLKTNWGRAQRYRRDIFP